MRPNLQTALNSSFPQTHMYLFLLTIYSVNHLLTISTWRGSRLVGAEDGTANWIFFLSLGSTSTWVGTEASMSLDPEESDSQWKGQVTGKDHSNLPGRSSHCWVVSLLNPRPLSICLALTLVVTKLRILFFFSAPAVESIQHLPLFFLFLPSLTTRAAGVNEASLWVSGGEREKRVGRAWGSGLTQKKAWSLWKGAWSGPVEAACVGGIFPVNLRADVDSVTRKK